MALTPAFPGPTGVTTTTHGRRAIAGLLVKDAAGVARSGVFPAHPNAIVTARTNMNVDIAAFTAAAVQFGGPILFSNDGTAQLPSVLVSPGAGTNYYVVYAKQNESASPGTDLNNNTVFGAAVSTVSFAAARATLPTGALELATVEMPTGKTATNQSGVVITQTFQYTAPAGSPVWVRNASELAALTLSDGALAYQLDAARHWRRTGGGWASISGGLIPIAPTSVVGGTVAADGGVDFSASSGVSLNGVFSAMCRRYKIVYTRTAVSTSSLTHLRLRLAGVDATGSGDYGTSVLYRDQGASDTIRSGHTGGVSFVQLDDIPTTGKEEIEIEVIDPAVADPTLMQMDWVKRTSATTAARGVNGAAHALLTAYDGVTIYPNTGTITGRIEVYGYAR